MSFLVSLTKTFPQAMEETIRRVETERNWNELNEMNLRHSTPSSSEV